MNVGRHMQRDAVTALPSATVGTIRRVMEEHGFGLLLLASEDGSLQGFVTRASLRGVADGEAAVNTVSHPVRFAVQPTDTLEKAALIMLDNRLVLLPVVEGDRLVGVITQSEVLRGGWVGNWARWDAHGDQAAQRLRRSLPHVRCAARARSARRKHGQPKGERDAP
jgi:CBS-domain-containing membrane protein